jgi:type IV pilus assembly protein PilA
MTTDEQGSALYAALIGEKRRDYYLKRFESFDDRGGGFIPSWNWAAFIFSGLWPLYRKMYAVFFVIFGISIVGEIIYATEPAGAPLFYLIFLVLWFGIGIYGNALYYRHTKRKIAEARTTQPDAEKLLSYMQSKGGVHVWIIWVFLSIPIVGILAAIGIPAYQDYTIRAQVSEGLNLSGAARDAVTDRFEATGELAANNEIAGLPSADRLVGKYTSSVAIDAGNVVITYGNDAHALIASQTILLTPEIQPNNLLSWTCSSQSIRPVHLPAACR